MGNCKDGVTIFACNVGRGSETSSAYLVVLVRVLPSTVMVSQAFAETLLGTWSGLDYRNDELLVSLVCGANVW